jgi:hypothetical protein
MCMFSLGECQFMQSGDPWRDINKGYFHILSLTLKMSNRVAGEMRAGAGKGRITSKGTLQWVGDSGDLYELAG